VYVGKLVFECDDQKFSLRGVKSKKIVELRKTGRGKKKREGCGDGDRTYCFLKLALIVTGGIITTTAIKGLEIDKTVDLQRRY